MRIKLKEAVYILLISILIQSCKDDSGATNPELKNPTVKIMSPRNEVSFVDSTMIIVHAEDDRGIVQVEIFINNKTDSAKTFYVPPYEYAWKPPFNSDSTKYSIFAKAYDAEGNVGVSDVVFVYVRKFGPPSNLRRESISETAVLLSWDDNSAVNTGFEIQRKTNDSEFRILARLDSNITSILDDKIIKSNEYTYRVRAINGNSFTEFSNSLSIRYRYDFHLDKSIDGQHLNGIWGDSYTPVQISNDNLIYSYSFENSPFLMMNQFSYTTSGWSYILDNQEGSVFDIEFNHSDNKFLLGTNKGQIYSWKALSTDPGKTFITETDTVYSVSFCKNKSIFASSEANGVITIWDYNTGAKKKVIKTNVTGRTIVLLLPDGNTLLSGDPNGVIKYWDANNGILIRVLTSHTKPVTQLLYNEAKGIIMSSSLDGYIKLYYLSNGSLFGDRFLIASGITDISMDRAGTKLIVCGNGNFMYLKYPDLNPVLNFSDIIFKKFSTVSLSPDGQKLLVGANRHVGFYSDSSKWRVY